MNASNFVYIVGALLVFTIIGFGIGYALPPVSGGLAATSTVACPGDGYRCPDGTIVGRVPPSCSFAVCPGMPGARGSVMSVQAALGGSAVAFGLRITPLSVVVDTRCPLGTACRRPGSISVRTELVGMGVSRDPILTLGVPYDDGPLTVTLVDALPPRSALIGVIDGYSFMYSVVIR